jgi:hypothetical protein
VAVSHHYVVGNVRPGILQARPSKLGKRVKILPSHPATLRLEKACSSIGRSSPCNRQCGARGSKRADPSLPRGGARRHARDFSHAFDAFEPLPAPSTPLSRVCGARPGLYRIPGRRTSRSRRQTCRTRACLLRRWAIITPHPGRAFLAIAATVRGTRSRLQYFANRAGSIFRAEIAPVRLNYLGATDRGRRSAGRSFKAGVKVFVFSNPNNPRA